MCQFAKDRIKNKYKITILYNIVHSADKVVLLVQFEFKNVYNYYPNKQNIKCATLLKKKKK